MNSGIYRLTFSSGKFYIGKSIDVDTRWKQHFNKFATGKAARPMQLEYEKCGLPKTEVIFNCHRDHIDILEEWLIDEYKCENMLNTTYPEVERSDAGATLINKNKKLLQLSTFEHLEMLQSRDSNAETAEKLARGYHDQLKNYRRHGYIVNQDFIEVVDAAQKLKTENDELYNELEQTNKQLTQANHELYRLKNLNWFQRLFDYSVYV